MINILNKLHFSSKDFIYLREGAEWEREHECGGEGQRDDLSQRQTLNWLSHPDALKFLSRKFSHKEDSSLRWFDMWIPWNILLFYFILKKILFIYETERKRGRGRSRLPEEQGDQCGTDPRTQRSWPELKADAISMFWPPRCPKHTSRKQKRMKHFLTH